MLLEFGTGPLLDIDGTVNAEIYLDLLKKFALPEIAAAEQQSRLKMYFMHDNAPCHKSKSVQKKLCDNRINVLDWPPYIPDLNPIGNLFEIIKSRLSKMKPTASMDEMEDLALKNLD